MSRLNDPNNSSYCIVYMGRKGQNAAMDECKTLNAQLPLPKSRGEADKFRTIIWPVIKITGNEIPIWIGIKDSTKSGSKSNWKDAEGNSVGKRFVNLRVKI